MPERESMKRKLKKQCTEAKKNKRRSRREASDGKASGLPGAWGMENTAKSVRMCTGRAAPSQVERGDGGGNKGREEN